MEYIKVFFTCAFWTGLIMGFIMMIGSALPNKVEDYLENKYHTNDIEIVWESKVFSIYDPSIDLLAIDSKAVNAKTFEDVVEVTRDFEELQKRTQPNSTAQIIKFKVDGEIKEVAVYFGTNGDIIRDNTDINTRLIKTINYINNAQSRILE